MTLRDLPDALRPREKLLARGAAALADVELLALILRTGIEGKDVLTLAEELPEFDTASTFNKPLWSTPPEKAAQVILQGVRKKRSRIMVGPDTKVLVFLVRMTGSGYQWLVPRVGRLFMKPIR